MSRSPPVPPSEKPPVPGGPAGQVTSAASPITPRDPSSAPELSPVQLSIWERATLLKDNPVYTLVEGYRINGPLDIVALNAAVKKVLRRHEVLRTVIRKVGGAPLLEVDRRGAFEGLTYLSIAGEGALRRAEGIFNYLAVSSVSLETAPLLRAILLAVGAQDHVLIITTHHLVFDGWSARVLLTELSAFYREAQVVGQSSIPDLPVQAGDVAIWTRARLQDGLRDKQLKFWSSQLPSPYAPARLPRRSTGPGILGGMLSHGNLPIVFDTGTTDAVTHVARAEMSTPFIVLLAGFAAALAAEAGVSEVCIATHAANRSRPEVQGLIGYFTNMVLLRIQVVPGSTFRDLIRSVRDTVLDAVENADVPIADVIEMIDAQGGRNGGRPEVVASALFLAEAGEAQVPELRGTSVEPFPKDRHSDNRFRYTPVDVNLTLTPEKLGMSGLCSYRSDRLERGTAESLLARFARILQQGVKEPGTLFEPFHLKQSP